MLIARAGGSTEVSMGKGRRSKGREKTICSLGEPTTQQSKNTATKMLRLLTFYNFMAYKSPPHSIRQFVFRMSPILTV